MGNRWLTPDTAPTALASRCLFIPDAVDWISLVAGALLTLTYPGNFEQYGTATPEETADAFRTMFDAFSFNQGVCRVIGEIVTVAATANPNPGNWLECDGTSVLRTDYPDLFTAIGTTYGSTDSTHFNIPDLRGRVVMGSGSGYAIGDTGGETDHTLTTTEMPAHTHTEITATGTLIPVGVGAAAPSAIPGIGVTGNAGGDGSHNNLQPYLVLSFYIVAL